MTRLQGLVVVACLPGCFNPAYLHDQEDFDSAGRITAIDVSNTTGDIVVRGVEGTKAHAEADLFWVNEQPDVTWDVDGETLVVTAACLRPFWYCRVDLTLEIPYDAAAAIELGTGDIRVEELDGTVDVDTVTGDIALTDLRGDVVAETTTGQVTGRQLTGDTVTVDITTGSVDLVHEDDFDLVDLRTTTGDVSLLVPGGTYDCTADTTTGHIDITGIVDDPNATATIRAVTTTGTIEIVGYTTTP